MLCSTVFAFAPPMQSLAQAERTLRFITEQYFSPNLSVDEMRKLVRKWTDPLEPFGEACRHELKSMRTAV
jgi:hypothetical protein